ncbi:MAG TPA: hypothetical protein VHM91_06750 [Verrucomicrobiales bacterium]|jgi:hypothetical protein|nr:hypothetical protein [Verrucomicrobiales bacterium]
MKPSTTLRTAGILCTALLTTVICPAADKKPKAAKETPPPAKEEPEKVVPDKGAGELDLTKFPGKVVEEVIVPVPSEIFSALDRLGDPDWKAQVNRGERPAFTERTDVALLLGATVADGFIAVQAEDKKTVENVGKDVLALATALGVREDVLKHCQAIDDAAKIAKWDVVRTELDATQATVKDKMESLRDGALAECISVGGWLRGTEVITAVIGKSFSKDRAELLYQPDLADYFNDALEDMLTKAKSPAKLKSIADGLAQLREIMQSGDENLSEKAVNDMHRITAALVKSIITKK